MVQMKLYVRIALCYIYIYIGDTRDFVLIYMGSYVNIRGRVIECPSISIMEDTAVTHTLGRDGAAYYQG